MLEIGKKYQFDFKKQKKLLEGSYIKYWSKENEIWRVRQLGFEMHYVFWVEENSFLEDVEVLPGKFERIHFQKVKFCRPFEGFEIAFMIFKYDSDLLKLSRELSPAGQDNFEEMFVNATVHETILDLW